MTLAGTVSWVTRVLGPGLRVIEARWKSDAAGDVDSECDPHGIIDRLITVPSDNAPTALYDVTLEAPLGVDFLGGVGANRNATVRGRIPWSAPLRSRFG